MRTSFVFCVQKGGSKAAGAPSKLRGLFLGLIRVAKACLPRQGFLAVSLILLLAAFGRHDGPVAPLSRTLSTFADLTDEIGRTATGAVRASTDASVAVRDAFLDVLVGANTLSAEVWRGTELRNVSMRVIAGRAVADDPRVPASWLASDTARRLTGGDDATHDTLLALADALVQGLPQVAYSDRVVSDIDDFFSVSLKGMADKCGRTSLNWILHRANYTTAWSNALWTWLEWPLDGGGTASLGLLDHYLKALPLPPPSVPVVYTVSAPIGRLIWWRLARLVSEFRAAAGKYRK